MYSKESTSKGKKHFIPQGNGPHSTLLDINQISFSASDDGTLERDLLTQTAGVFYPIGTASVVYGGGIVWGGIVHDGAAPTTRVGGATLATGTTRGAIVAPGLAEDTSNDGVRIYRIRRDWKTADLTNDAAQLLGESPYDVTAQDIANLRAQYAKDWLEWPWQKGAPYYERNGISGYQPDTSGAPGADEPGLGDADQVIWFVCNDLNPTPVSAFASSVPIGFEEQVTLWAYDRGNALDSVVFERYRLIYKGTSSTAAGSYIDSMYIAKWGNPNIGGISDDYAGYDSLRNLAYAWNPTNDNTEFDQYNIVPPAFGYDLLEGPRVPAIGSTAHWNLGVIHNYANLSVTSALIFQNTYNEIDSTNFSGDTPVRQWMNILHGYRPRPALNPPCFTDPFLNECAHYMITGDPVTNTGWVDGRQYPAGDRRIVLASGPFHMALGDTQEIVVALVGGLGADHYDSMTKMRANDDAAQDVYGLSFNVPDTVPEPDLRIVELNQSLILDWGTDTTAVKRVEGYRSQGFQFYNYAIYQYLDSSSTSQSAKFPPFDLSQPRSLNVSTDLIRNQTLVNGRNYYYAVTAIMYNPLLPPADQYIESVPIVEPAVPHMPNPGTVYPYGIGDTVSSITNLNVANDATIQVVYYDPTEASGNVYGVLFHRSGGLTVTPTWDLLDTTKHETFLSGEVVNNAEPIRVVGQGFTISVISPSSGVKGVFQTEYAGEPSQASIFNTPNPQRDLMVVGGGLSILDTLSGGSLDDQDIEWRFQGDSSWSLFANTKNFPDSKWRRVPFTLWEISKYTQRARQVYAVVMDAGGDSIWRPSNLLNRSYNGKMLQEFYPVSVFADSVLFYGVFYGGRYYDNVPFLPLADSVRYILWASAQALRIDSRMTIWEAYLVNLNQESVPAPNGTIIRLEKYKQILNGEMKLVKTRATVTDNYSAAQQAVNLVNVFPNPYYGFNPDELSRSQKFITFSHLPQMATIRIFNLAGVLVRTLTKNDPTQFITWDLNNESALPVASGIYLAHIEMSDVHSVSLGAKILKLMIVQEQHYLQTN
jgi:hypothetical protein